jgi:DNA-binding MltR family transcriptional regulator
MADIDLKTLIRNLFEGIEHSSRMTHSGIVIALSAILDNQLERALKRALRPLSNNMYERLFDSFGPLSNFSSKIVMAYALGIIPLELYEELEKIRHIRNEFAHSSGVLHLESPAIESLFLTLKRPSTQSKTPAEVFLACAKVIDDHLEAYLTHPVEPSA